MAFEDIFGDLPPPAVHSSPPVTSPPPPPPATASSPTSEIITALHTPPPPPAATPLNIHNDHISNHVKFKLDPAENNYTKWRMFFNLVLLQYRVQDHVTRPPPPNPDADWLAVDQRLMLWIYFTLSDNLLELIMGGAVDAYTAWTRIKDYFLANQGARYLHLTRQYRNLKQGDLSMSDYARRLKTLADGLADTGNPVSDHDLTMQLLHGLDNRFDTIRTILGDQSPLPPFDVARSRLDLAEYTINLRAAEASSSALTISGGSGAASDRGDRGDRAKSAPQVQAPVQ
ncbi:hypothetical protein D1007_38356 [Hordeum vulgare]|nr:hypothetical protein D1007_38356 [Hordeum vulgare]